MTIQVIPTDDTGVASYLQQTTLEGTTYNLAFQYNQRCACWYLSIADASNVDIYNGIKLVVGIPLLRKCTDPRRPPGDFLVISSTTDDSPPSLLDLLPDSGRCQLLYITSDWLKLIGQGKGQTVLDQLAANAQTTAISTYGID